MLFIELSDQWRPGRELALVSETLQMFLLHLEEINGLLVFCMCLFSVRYIDYQKKGVDGFPHLGFSKPYKALEKRGLFFKSLLRCA